MFWVRGNCESYSPFLMHEVIWEQRGTEPQGSKTLLSRKFLSVSVATARRCIPWREDRSKRREFECHWSVKHVLDTKVNINLMSLFSRNLSAQPAQPTTPWNKEALSLKSQRFFFQESSFQFPLLRCVSVLWREDRSKRREFECHICIYMFVSCL